MTRQPPNDALVSLANIDALLAPSPSRWRMAMPGFDPEFFDIADYIVRITDRIWHERKIDLCRDYYTEDCVIHTLAGDVIGAAAVEANTHATLKSFPDRTLDPDNVIWSAEDGDAFYTSHLITSRMTNLGPTEYGPATGIRARIRTIADCLCRDNRIEREWLVRDNAALVMQLGFDLAGTASRSARQDADAGLNLTTHFSALADAMHPLAPSHEGKALPAPEQEPAAFANALFARLWNGKDLSALDEAFDFRVGAHLPAMRELYGVLEYREFMQALFQAIPGFVAQVDHVASIPYLGGARDIAVRWSLSGVHRGDGLFGPACDARIYLFGVSHWRVANGRIREEWMVFDELALLRQIEGVRLRR
ncbi:MAG: ester cyclase [Parvularculaceae bacterium]|nr:ester cyclase [Parvularculaceae bacterium]